MPIPTNNNRNNNNHSLDQQSYDPDDNDDNTIVTSNTSSSISSKTATDTMANYHQANPTAAKIVSYDANIGDAGATSTFLMTGAPVKNMKVSKKPLAIQLPNSTHTCNLDIDLLPEEATEVHIVLDLAHTSLISICQLCDNGCTVTYDKHACKVYCINNLVWLGTCKPKTGLWVLLLQPNKPPTKSTQSNHNVTQYYANSAYTITSKAELIKFLHQCAFSLTTSTWIKAINNNQFPTCPGLTAAAVR